MASMLPMLRRQFSSTLAVFLMLISAPAAVRAEDGYDLWLRYAPIESAPLRDAYRQTIAGFVVQQSSETAAIVTERVDARPQGPARHGRAGVDMDRRDRRRRAGGRHAAGLGDREGTRLGRRPEAPGPGRIRHSPRAHRRQTRARRGLGGRRRRALRHVPPAAPAGHGDADPAARRAREAAPPGAHPQPLGQPRWIDRARLRRPLAVEVGRAAGVHRPAPSRLRPRQRLDRPQRHRHQQRQRQPASRSPRPTSPRPPPSPTCSGPTG